MAVRIAAPTAIRAASLLVAASIASTRIRRSRSLPWSRASSTRSPGSIARSLLSSSGYRTCGSILSLRSVSFLISSSLADSASAATSVRAASSPARASSNSVAAIRVGSLADIQMLVRSRIATNSRSGAWALGAVSRHQRWDGLSTAGSPPPYSSSVTDNLDHTARSGVTTRWTISSTGPAPCQWHSSDSATMRSPASTRSTAHSVPMRPLPCSTNSTWPPGCRCHFVLAAGLNRTMLPSSPALAPGLQPRDRAVIGRVRVTSPSTICGDCGRLVAPRVAADTISMTLLLPP